MLPWYHLHSNVKTFLIRPITGSSVVSYCCSPVQKRCLEATFCHCLAKTPSSLWVSLSVGGLLHTPLPHYIITDNFSEKGGGCQGVQRLFVSGKSMAVYRFRNPAETFAARGPLSLVKCVTVWMPMLTHIQASHTDALKAHSSQNVSAGLLQYLKLISVPRHNQAPPQDAKTKRSHQSNGNSV